MFERRRHGTLINRTTKCTFPTVVLVCFCSLRVHDIARRLFWFYIVTVYSELRLVACFNMLLVVYRSFSHTFGTGSVGRSLARLLTFENVRILLSDSIQQTITLTYGCSLYRYVCMRPSVCLHVNVVCGTRAVAFHSQTMHYSKNYQHQTSLIEWDSNGYTLARCMYGYE